MQTIEANLEFINTALNNHSSAATNVAALFSVYGLYVDVRPSFIAPNSTDYFKRPLFEYTTIGSTRSIAEIRVMKGTMPDAADLALSDRSEDVLVRYKMTDPNVVGLGIYPAVYPPTVQMTTEYMAVNTRPTPIEQSGTASWFWIVSYVYGTTDVYHQVVGDIGLTGSQAAVEVPNTDLVEGNVLQLLMMKLGLPREFEVLPYQEI